MKDVMWWVTVAFYWVVVGLCVIAARRERPPLPWKLSAVFFAVLAVNKQHDLTGYITRWVRRTAWMHDWYDARRVFQWHVLYGICFAAAAVLVAMWIWTTRLRWSIYQRFTLLAAVGLLAFAFIRAVSLHGVDRLLYRERLGIQLNWVLEIGALLMAAAFICFSLLKKSRGQ